MARAPAAKKEIPATNNERLRLIEALKFAAGATEKSDNSALSQFATIHNHWVLSENETFCLGAYVETELDICLKAEMFQHALMQCENDFKLTQITEHELSVKSGKFRAIIPVLSQGSGTALNPDDNVLELGVNINEAFSTCIKACSGKGDRSIDESVLLCNGSMIGTNGQVALEYWHGYLIPHDIAIPKKTVEAINKIKKSIIGFGFDDGKTATFHFEDLSFIKTRLHATPWPDIRKLFATHAQGTFAPLWASFADGVQAVSKFVENDCLFFHNGVLATDMNLEIARATYAVANLPENRKFGLSYWKQILPFAEFVSMPDDRTQPMAFRTNAVRGLLMGRH